MSEPIETAPRDGTVIFAAKKSRRGWSLYFTKSRFLDGKWCMHMGDDRWVAYDPQPDIWAPESTDVLGQQSRSGQ